MNEAKLHEPEPVLIDHNAYILVVRDWSVLLVREKKRKLFTLPGGGQSPGETPAKTASRELQEELDWKVDAADLVPTGTYFGPTGRKKRLQADCFIIRNLEEISLDRLGPDIIEVAWVNSENLGEHHTSWIVKHAVIPDLASKGLVK